MGVICDGKRCAKKQECTRFLAFEDAVKLEPDKVYCSTYSLSRAIHLPSDKSRVIVFRPSPRVRTGDDHCVGFERT